MTRDELKVIITLIAGAYNKFSIDDKGTFELWFSALKTVDYAQCKAGIYHWVITHKFPPTIVEIREEAMRYSDRALERDTAFLKVGFNFLMKCIKKNQKPHVCVDEFGKYTPVVKWIIENQGLDRFLYLPPSEGWIEFQNTVLNIVHASIEGAVIENEKDLKLIEFQEIL